jgi:hypothetical protein
MAGKTEIDMGRTLLFKGVRAIIRLRHSMAADRELNDRLPDVERKYNQAVLKGTQPAVTIQALLLEVGNLEPE